MQDKYRKPGPAWVSGCGFLVFILVRSTLCLQHVSTSPEFLTNVYIYIVGRRRVHDKMSTERDLNKKFGSRCSNTGKQHRSANKKHLPGS